MYLKKILCLANSRKHAGRCIAGIEITGGGFGDWIRPISARSSHELSEEERGYENGQDPKVLDVISVPLSSPHASVYQTENHIIDPNYYWTKRRTATWTEVLGAVETIEGPLWINGHSTSIGQNDRVPENVANTLDRSLYLIKPESLSIIVAVEGEAYGNPKRKLRAEFRHNNFDYTFAVTDPSTTAQYLGQANGTYQVGEVVLCVSLSEIHNDHYAYKLVATVILP
jgi:hypothetical protein